MDRARSLWRIGTMNDQKQPVVFATIYTVGVISTIALALMIRTFGADLLKAAIPVAQIIVATAAILSAWALQDSKRRNDARDAAEATADAVLAVTHNIDRLASWATKRAKDGKMNQWAAERHSQMIDEDIKTLSGVPLTALKPASAATALIQYRRHARQFCLVLEIVAEKNGIKQLPALEERLEILRGREDAICEALNRPVPDGK